MIKHLEEMEEYAHEHEIPIIKREALKFILDYLGKRNIKSILEIGTAIGYSGGAMALATGAPITTIEKDPELAVVAKQNFKKLGVNANVINGDASAVLDILATKRNAKYNLVFLDGPKGQYLNYLPKIFKLLEPNGILIADNVNFRGLITRGTLEPEDKRYKTIVTNLKKFVEAITTHKWLDTHIYDIGDGISISVYAHYIEDETGLLNI